MMLAQRLMDALEIIGQDHQVTGSIRDQASTYLGEPCDDQCLHFLEVVSRETYVNLYEAAQAGGANRKEANAVGLISVLLGGLALGKRLGIEDGERFAKMVGDPE